MLHVSVHAVRPGKEAELRGWLEALAGPRRDEARATLVDEGVAHEVATLVEVGDTTLVVYAMECDDLAAAMATFAASTRDVDREHARVMTECVRPEVLGTTVLDVTP